MNLPRWTKKWNFGRLHHQEQNDAINALDNLDGSEEIEVVVGNTGKGIFSNVDRPYYIRCLGVIVVPETDSVKYTDPRYRVEIRKVLKGDAANTYEELVKLAVEDDPLNQHEGTSTMSEDGATMGFTVTATNTAEMTNPATGEGTHGLQEDGKLVVEVFCIYDEANPRITRWFFSRPPGLAIYQGAKSTERSATKLVANIPLILNMSTERDTDQILEFFADSVDIAASGSPADVRPCVSLRFKQPPSGGVYLRCEGDVLSWDRIKYRDD